MKCCVCESNIDGYGNNPYPLCAKDDYESRCCNICNSKVIQARIVSTKLSNKTINQLNKGDEIVIFHTKQSNDPIELINCNSQFLAGIVETIEMSDDLDGKYVAFGTWGNYFITDEDSFMLI